MYICPLEINLSAVEEVLLDEEMDGDVFIGRGCETSSQ
jgi:hypothetical protein